MSSSKAYVLARRHSVKNEHDLLQEDFVNDGVDDLSPPVSPYSQKACYDLLGKVHYPESPLPAACEQFDEIRVALQRTNSNRAVHAKAFQGMHAGEAAAAMASREKGQLHHAQIQRRMTNNKPRLW